MSNQHLSRNAKENTSFITILCFVPQKKNTDLEHISQFLQPYGIHFKRFNKINNAHIFDSIPRNANYIGRNKKPILVEHLELIYRFLSSKLIIVAFCHHNQFLNPARLSPALTLVPFDPIWTQAHKIVF